jgi:hypothetical protein
MEEQIVNPWDRLTIQIELGEEYGGKATMMKDDIDNLCVFHNMSRGQVIDMLLGALETTPKKELTE